MKKNIKSLFNFNIINSRSNNLFKQIKLSFIFKFFSIILTFLLVRIMLDFLGVEQYGIWSTMYGIVSWFLIMDIGLANGTRNKVSEAIARDHKKTAKIYISTSYISIFIISIIIFSLVLWLSFFINWQSVFNTVEVSNTTLRNTFIILSFFVLLNFSLSIVNSLFHAIQRSSFVVINQFLSNFIALIFVYYISFLYQERIDILAFVYGFSLSCSSLFFNVFFFKTNKSLFPNVRLFNKKIIKIIMYLGIKFFIIQIAALIIFTTDKILILQIFGPKEVVSYEVLLKLFSLLTVIHGIIMSPLWSTFTEAHSKKDFNWMKNIIRKLNFLMFPFVIMAIILLFFANDFIAIWIGKDLNIEISLMIYMAIFTLLSIWSGIYANFLNGINAINLQVKTLIIGALINIPLSLIFVYYFSMGIEGIIIASILSLSLFAVVGPWQTYKILDSQSMPINSV